ncbi:hypothetical protein G7054_g474 [Neopestalotiopsis clavispora]|nr:hypothetical protein G7054_g474 [Neopestalotiopsis clavispora]
MAVFSKIGAFTWALTLAGLVRSHGDLIADRDLTSDVLENGNQLLSVPLTRIHQSLMPEIPLQLRTRFFQSSVRGILGAAYLANITVGTGNPAQSVQVLLDTGSYELWVNPNCSKSSVPEQCETFGQFDPNLSPTAQDLNATSQIRYGSGSVNISYYTDDISISSGRIDTQQFGIATDSQNVWFGIMGLGYGRRQTGSTKGSLKYDSVIDNIYDQQYTNSRLFGLELGLQGKPQIAVTGQIIFGGVDTNKYAGNLHKIPFEEVDSHYRVKLTSVSHRTPANVTSTITETTQIVIVDSGTTLSILPRDIVELIASQFPGATYDGDGAYRVPCTLQDEPGSLSFSFNETIITVPYSEFIWGAGPLDGEDLCLLGVQWNTNPNTAAAASYLILGDTFMRAAYTVFDQDNNAVYMSNYTTCGTQSSIVAVPAGIDAAANIPGKCPPPTVSEPATTTATTGTNATPISSAIFSNGDPNPVGPVSMTPSISSSVSSSVSATVSGSSSSDVTSSSVQQSATATSSSTGTAGGFTATSSFIESPSISNSPATSSPDSSSVANNTPSRSGTGSSSTADTLSISSSISNSPISSSSTDSTPTDITTVNSIPATSTPASSTPGISSPAMSAPGESTPSESTQSSGTTVNDSPASSSAVRDSSMDSTTVDSTGQSTIVGGTGTQTTAQSTTIESTTSGTPSATVTSLPEDPIILAVLSDGGAAKNGTAKRSIFSAGAMRPKKRQSDGGFVGGAGPANPSSCSDASGFSLVDGQLVTSDGSIVATEPGVESMALRVSPTGGSINTTFAVVDGVLHWFNDALFGGEATFCQTPDGQVNLVFTEDGAPDGCGEVSIAAYPASQCQDGELVLSSTIPSSSLAASTTAASGGSTVAVTMSTSTAAANTGDGVDQSTVSPAPVTQTSIITTTVTNYVAYTITACPPSVQDCPIGQIATSTQVHVTTICHEDSATSTVPTTTQPPSSAGGGGAPAVDGGNAVAVIVAVTVTEECETSTFAVSTCAAGDGDCVLGSTTTATYTRYRTVTTTNDVTATAITTVTVSEAANTSPNDAAETSNGASELSEAPVIPPYNDVQMGSSSGSGSGSGFNSSAPVNFACPGCAVNVVPSGSAAFDVVPTASRMPVQAGAERSSISVVGVVVSALIGTLMLVL